MTTPVQPHILTVSETTKNGITEQGYEIECPGVTDRCRQQVACRQDGCTDDTLDEDPVAHGVEHHWSDGDWYVPTDRCHLSGHDSLPEAAEALNLRPGKYPVNHYFGDGFDLELDVRVEVKS